VKTQTHQSFSPDESCGGSATQFSSPFLYVDVRLAYDVLDPVDPWLKFTISKYGHGVVRRG